MDSRLTIRCFATAASPMHNSLHHALRHTRHLVLLTACLLAARGAAAADRIVFEDSSGRIVTSTLLVGARSYPVDWYLPSAAPVGFAQVQHGFTRRCANLRDTTKALMRKGLMALCLNADMTGGNPALADALAAALVAGLTAPDGRPVPERIVVSGHSAGGMFASRLGATLHALAPQRLAGAVLFDPVAANGSYTTNLVAISARGQRPVQAVTANGSGCNASNNGEPALRRLRDDALAAGRDGFVGVRLPERSTHVDVEGNNTNRLGWISCLQGAPRSFNVTNLRTLASQWAADAAAGERTPEVYPGGSVLDALIDADRARLIE